MRIKRLELLGFKSFVEPTAFQFGPGIGGVVGPNGCGKSNVIDAIRWVLGEQSAGALRGRGMADVIFSGAEGRSPANFAEVRLVFDNTDGSFGGKLRRFVEIEIERRLDRSGLSLYAINRRRCRLKDITDLFLDTGVGARAYSIIEQGRVGFIVNARPEERRVLIEEVAGINRFKSQRAEAERRIDATRANLVRLADLGSELERQVSALAAQVRVADQFLAHRRSWREGALRVGVLEAAISLRDREQADQAVGAAEREALRLDEEARAALAQLERHRAELSEHQAARDRGRERLSAVLAQLKAAGRERALRAEELETLNARAGRLDQEVHAAQEARDRLVTLAAETRARAERGRDELARSTRALEEATAQERERRLAAQAAHAEVERLKERLLASMTEGARHRNSLAHLRLRLDEIAAELQTEQRAGDADDGLGADASRGLAKAEETLQRATDARIAGRAAVVAADASLAASATALKEAGALAQSCAASATRLDARLRAERELIRTLQGASPGVRDLVAWIQSDAGSHLRSGLLGVVADLVPVSAGNERAVEGALGDLLAAAVFRDLASLRAAALWLAAKDGRVGALILLQASAPPEGPLDEAAALRQQLLGDLESVVDVAALDPTADRRQTTPGGSTAELGVLRVGPRSGAAMGLLARRREVRELESELAASVAQSDAAKEGHAMAQRAHEGAEAVRSLRASDLHETELNELGRRRDVDECRRAARSIAEQRERRLERRGKLAASHARLSAELDTASAAEAMAQAVASELERQLATARDVVLRADVEANQEIELVGRHRVLQAEARHEAAAVERDARRVEDERVATTARLAGATRELELAQLRRGRLVEQESGLSVDAQALEQERLALDDAVPQLDQRARQVAEEVQRAREAAHGAQSASEQSQRSLAQARAGHAGAAARLGALADRVAADFDVDLLAHARALLAAGRLSLSLSAGPEAAPIGIELDAAALSEDLAPHRAAAAASARAAESLGPVNLAARREHDDAEGRRLALDTQRQDLEQALTDLRAAIAKIERETKQRFREAFDQVSRGFAALYPKLVGGGSAELALTDPASLLESGVEVRVEPPGKRLQNLQLLSGGEKAMAAIALVFAIFEVKPSPFCLLDEVDAPLDEANSRRFNAMLRELSASTQFVVITHNRTTMEVADVLYGVTMQLPGVSSVVSVRLDELSI